MEEITLLPFVPEPPRTFHQLGILILDGSESMRGKKAQEVAQGVRSLLDRMKESRIKNNFSFACIAFDDNPAIVFPPTPVNELNYGDIDFNPCKKYDGGTNIHRALLKAENIIDSFFHNATDDLPHNVVILLMSDGLCHYADLTRKIARKIKTDIRVKIACAYFCDGEEDYEASLAIELLQNIASGPSYYSTVYDGNSLRKFFEASISNSLNKSSAVEIFEEEETLPPLADINELPPGNYLTIFVIDGSSSMRKKGRSGRPKGIEAAEYAAGVVNYYQNEQTKHERHIACIVFDSSPSLIISPTPLPYSNDFNFNPLAHKERGTRINAALELAYKTAQEFLQQPDSKGREKYVFILLYSDGLCENSKMTERIAQKINNSSGMQLEVVYFSGGANDKEAAVGKALLQRIVPRPDFFIVY